jgi:PAS domain S-box-containing protein
VDQEELLDRIDDGFFALDDEWRFTYLNDRAEQLLGRDSEALLGENVWEAFPDATDDAFYGRYHEAVETQQPVQFEEWYEPHGAWYSVHAYPSETGLSVFFRDVTGRKRRERELKRQNARLERFASILSHDLKNPLGVARGNAELLADVLDDVDDPAADTALSNVESIRDAHERMDEIIDSVLTLAREGNAVDSLHTVAIEDVATDAWAVVETDDATLVVETDVAVEADPERLELVLSNLFRNAVEHGGADATVRVGATAEGFYVADDGPGIPEAERPDVFEYGYTTAADGTGFGLAIVEEIATAHGWQVSITGGHDGGARFEFDRVAVVE